MRATPLLLDMDPGVDDALALLMALRCPDARVLEITTVRGNCDLDSATRNARIVVGLSGVEPAPRLTAGAAVPLSEGSGAAATEIHSGDGLGGVSAAYSRYARPAGADARGEGADAPSDAADAILRALEQSEGRVTLAATGPLTNLALALRRNPEAFRSVDLVVMGGAFRCPGNVTPCAEFNVYADPVAASEVMASGASQFWVPLDVTETVVLTEERLKGWRRRYPGVLSRFIADCTGEYLGVHRGLLGMEGIHVHDAVAVGLCLWPDLYRCEELSAAVETGGALTRGQTVADLRLGCRPWPPGRRVRVATQVGSEAFLERFERAVFGEGGGGRKESEGGAEA